MQTDNLPTSSELPKAKSKSIDELLYELKEELAGRPKENERKKPVEYQPLRKLISKNALFWGLSTSQTIHQPLIARLLALKPKAAKKDPPFDFAEAIESWIDGVEEGNGQDRGIGLAVGLEAIAWAQAIPLLSARLDSKDAETSAIVSRLTACLLGQALTAMESDNPGALNLLLSVELPIVLSHALTGLASLKEARKRGRECFTMLMDVLLDGEGMPHASYQQEIQLLLASCTRILIYDNLSKKNRIAKSGRLQFDWLSRQTLRLARPDGANRLSDATDSPYFDELIKFATNLTGDESDIGAHKKMRGKRAAEDFELPPPSEHSEWSELAVLRSNWSASSPVMAVNYSDRSIRAELSVGHEVIFSGQSNPRVVLDGELLALASEWEEVCWESDDDLDYLELEAHFENGWKVQRQFLLAREDHFALVADAITGPKSSKIEYQHTLPMLEAVSVEQNEENTEGMMLGRKKIGPIVPLGLSEWKASSSSNRLREEPTRLEMSATSDTLYAPLFFGLDPSTRNQSLTWRQLTVAENLLIVPNDVAVAYRVQIGKSQWVIYRSMRKPGNRTFLGLNLVSDFYVARFQDDGEPELIIDIEPS